MNDPAPRPQEQLLIDALEEIQGERILCTTAGLGQFAREAARTHRQAHVDCHVLDLYHAIQLEHAREAELNNLTVRCAADLPEGEFDAVALPLSSTGEAELTRELMQEAHQRLRIGGHMYLSTDNPRDSWLQQQTTALFGRLKRRESARGVLYVATKREPLKKIRDFSCEFAYRDRERLLRAYSRPGVFSHRRVDPGGRKLMQRMEVGTGERVLDIGCGWGTVAFAAATRAEGVHVHAVDSHARAVQCTAYGAQLNGLDNLTTQLDATGEFAEGGTYDLALANPPYYAAFRIAEHFLRTARQALRPGGRILVVTKSPEWYCEHMPRWYLQVEVTPAKDYHVASGICPEI